MISVRNLLVCVLALTAAPAFAVRHAWDITEVYSNASGTVQYVEFGTTSNFQEQLSNHDISSNANTYTFPTNLGNNQTGNTHFLVATPAFAAQPGAVTPDYVFDGPNFFNAVSDFLDFNGFNTFGWNNGELPTNGMDALHEPVGSNTRTTAPNSPTNFAGETGSIMPPNTIVVNTSGCKSDCSILSGAGADGNCSVGNSVTGACDGSGGCTLRAALEEANATPETDRIVFAIPGGSPQQIDKSRTIEVTNPVELDGSGMDDCAGSESVKVNVEPGIDMLEINSEASLCAVAVGAPDSCAAELGDACTASSECCRCGSICSDEMQTCCLSPASTCTTDLECCSGDCQGESPGTPGRCVAVP